VISGRCWQDAELDAAMAILDGRDDPAPRLRGALEHLMAVRHDPERSVLAFEAFQELAGKDVEQVRALAAADAGTSASIEAQALLVFALVGAAWRVRWAGDASSVSKEALDEFGALMEEADELALDVLTAVPGHPGAAVARLVTARGLGIPTDEWWYRFEQARKVRPTLYPAHVHMLQALCAKWYGNDSLMFDFARRIFHEAPQGDPVMAILPLAHLEYMVRLQGTAGKDRSRVNPVIHAERRRDQVGITAKGFHIINSTHPRSLEANQLVGWFEALFDASNARRHLANSGRRMAYYPWACLAPDPVGSYLLVRKELKMR